MCRESSGISVHTFVFIVHVFEEGVLIKKKTNGIILLVDNTELFSCCFSKMVTAG